MVDKEHGANYSLLMLWASLANAIPVSMNYFASTMFSYHVTCVH